MARLFDDASSDALRASSAPVTAFPFTLAAWGKSDVTNINQALVSIGLSSSNTNYATLRFSSAATVGAVCVFTTIGQDFTTDTISANTWHHAASVASTSQVEAFLDGVGSGSPTSHTLTASVNECGVGVTQRAFDIDYFSGDVAEVAMWNVALSDGEVAILAKGYSPLFVRPQSLAFYAPLIRGLNDRIGGVALTATGTSVSAHPPIIYPHVPILGVPAAAGGVTLPIFDNHYRSMRAA